ncbi:hypothetical protein [Hymenobacter sp. BT559]|uniref:hypothetical protein n=1 Tax=Hymenobacter sp. BT559 TaxID=2795729 RepID=UPI0018EC494B|nr:hypothetical protein [Hymenobacter sp. BT559]
MRPPISFWLLAFFTIALAGSAAYLYGAEFVTVGILKQTAGYPFGGEGPAHWTYQTPTRYASFTGSVGLLALYLLGSALWATIKQKEASLGLTLFLTILLLAAALVMGMIGLE